MTEIRHIAGPMEEGLQRCVVCGEILIDYRNAEQIVHLDSDGATKRTREDLKGWVEGSEVFVSEQMSSEIGRAHV